VCQSNGTGARVKRISEAFFSNANAKGKQPETPMNLPGEFPVNALLREIFTHNA
jgi:hypothetical protein